MLVIGLTGGIGSGKTTVSQLFAKQGVPIIDADVIAREITEPNQPVLRHIFEHFGKRVSKSDGHLNRAALRELIFANPKEREWLENLLHPIIREQIQKRLQEIQSPYCIVVIPLLHEVTAYPFLDRILVVDTDEAHQIARVMTRDQVNEAHVRAILNTQLTREKRRASSHDIILNDGDLEHLAKEVDKLHKFYLELSKKSSI